MANQITCPNCGQAYQLTPEQMPQYARQTITCTSCQQPFTVPGGLTGTPPPPAGAYPGTSPASPVGYAVPGPYSSAGGYGVPLRTNGWAITSLVSGLLGLFLPVIASLFGIITGIVGLTKTKDPRVGGKGLAIAGISVSGFTLLFSGCLLSILLPSLNRAREQANRIQCASNMRQIGMALQMYAATNRGMYPPDLQTLLATQSTLSSHEFICPTTTDTPAPGAGNTAQASQLNAGGHLSFVYIPNLRVTASANTPVLYEPLTNHRNDGVNVLFADGHVEFVPRQRLNAVIPQAAVNTGTTPATPAMPPTAPTPPDVDPPIER